MVDTIFETRHVCPGTPFAASSRIHGIQDWVSREKSPVKKPERNAVLPVDVGKRLHQRIVRFQQTGSTFTRSHVRRFGVQIFEEHSVYNPSRVGMLGKDWFISFVGNPPQRNNRRIVESRVFVVVCSDNNRKTI
jgi:hypothetical protein